MKSFEQMAQSAYAAYRKEAGGKTFDGKTLPTWPELDVQRKACWVAATKQVVSEYAALR